MIVAALDRARVLGAALRVPGIRAVLHQRSRRIEARAAATILLVFIHLHNFGALLLRVLVFRRRGPFPWIAALLLGGAVMLIVSGARAAWSGRMGSLESMGVSIPTVAKWLSPGVALGDRGAARVPMLVIGGVAVSIRSKPRTTKDVDAVAWLPHHDAWPAFLISGERHGIVPRIQDALELALSSRVLLLRHEGSGVPIDLSMGALPFEENAVRRAVLTEVGGLLVPLPFSEDLLVMKAVAHRTRDLVDIESILSVHPGVDETWIVSTVRSSPTRSTHRSSWLIS